MLRSKFFYTLATCMAGVVAISNFLVQFPVNYLGLENILTYAAFTYPITFLITDLANRKYGKIIARRVVYFGFFIGIILTLYFSTNFEDPSPSAATLFARFKSTLCNDLLNSRSFESLTDFMSKFFALPIANIETISFVLVSPSHVIALKVDPIFIFKLCFKTLEERFASVNTKPKVVAIFGKIIPEPFAMP